MKTHPVYNCLYRPVYLLGVPTRLFLCEFLLGLVLVFIVKTNVLVTPVLFIAFHFAMMALYRRNPEWVNCFAFFMRIPYRKIYRADRAYMPHPDESRYSR